MSINPFNIIPSKLIAAANEIQYTSSSGRTIIDKFTVTNVAAVSVSFSCNLIAYGDSATTANLSVDNRIIAPDETYKCPELVGHILENGDKISTIAGAVSSLTVRSSGRLIT